MLGCHSTQTNIGLMLYHSEAVRCGQVQGCSQCSVHPKTAGELCSTCDYRFRALGSRLKELDCNEMAFKSGK
jgi:hypothetical protein